MYLKDETPAHFTYLTGGENNDSHVKEGNKNFIFNSTGNIMIATTETDSSNMDESSRRVFNEVSVFFAAMTRAITNTPRPGSNENYSIYNYEALAKVIGGSGCFIHCTQEDIKYTSSSFGANFSKELLSALLALPTGSGSLAFAQAMISSIGQEGLKLSSESDTTNSKVGNIVFVCEFLFGMPIISAIVIYADSRSQKFTFQAGPCVKTSSTKTEMTLHKDVYMFVTPSFIKEYAADLDSIITSSEYGNFVSYLQSLLNDSLWIDGIYEEDRKVSGNALTNGHTYRIVGQNLGHEAGKLTLDGKEIPTNSWSDTEIKFTPSGVTDTPAPLVLTTKAQTAENMGNYKVVKADNK